MDDGKQVKDIDSMAEERTRRRAELDEFRRVMAELPIESPDDGFSGADHDRILYDVSAYSLHTRSEGDGSQINR